MEDFLKNARKQLGDIDLEKLLGDIDLSRFDKEQLKHIDLNKGAKKMRKQLKQLDTHQREEEAASEGFIGGLILGVIVGALLALIFAPRSGSETREIVAKTATDLTHKAEGLVSHKDESPEEPVVSTLPDEPAIERDFGTTDRPNSSML